MPSFVLCLSLCAAFCVFLFVFHQEAHLIFAASTVYAQLENHGAAASESDICTQVGMDLLYSGGNAADMIVGMSLCLGVVAMYHSGIGGGGFGLIRTPHGEMEVVDFREVAPISADPNMFDGRPDGQKIGGLASGVPGELTGLETIHSRYGQLPWKTVVMPAVHIAREGFMVTEDLVRFMESATAGREDFFVKDPAWAEDFAPQGQRVKVGCIITRKRYAATLEAIGEGGAEVFYHGWMANSTIQTIQNSGGIMVLDDLRQYRPVIRDPVQISYRGFTVSSCPNPAGGPVALFILKMLEGFDVSQIEATNLTSHRVDEAFRFGFGTRTLFGDPEFSSEVYDLERKVLEERHAAAVRERIWDNGTRFLEDYNPQLEQITKTAGTTHAVATDGDGMTISLTTTLNRYFGSHVIDPTTGIIYNCQMDDFATPQAMAGDLKPPSANYIQPGKRPLSSSSPVIVESSNGTFYVTLGAAGGHRILTTVVQLLLNLLDHHMPPEDALREPRMHDALLPNETSLELGGRGTLGFSNETAAFLQSLGHHISYVEPTKSAAHIILRKFDGTFEAAAEPRHPRSGAGSSQTPREKQEI